MSPIAAGDLFVVRRGSTTYQVAAEDLFPAWSPADLPPETLLCWLDASDLSTVTLGPNDGAAEWRDRSAAGVALGRVFTQPVANGQPPLTDPWIGRLDGLGGSLAQQNEPVPLPHVIVRVNAALAAAAADGFHLLITGGTTFETALCQSLSTPNALLTTATGSNIPANFIGRFTPIPAPAGTAYVSSAGYAVAAEDWMLRINGTAGTIQASTQVPVAALQGVAQVALAQYLVIAGNAADNMALIEQLEGWAAHKYGFAADLAEGHPYKEAPP